MADILRRDFRRIVVDVNSSLRLSDGQNYNLRARMWRDMREYLKNRFDGTEGARRQMALLDAQALRLAAKAESIRMQQAYVSLKTLYWRAVAEGHDDEAQRLLEENHDVIETVKKQIHSKADA